jgi:hypothetical protein
MFVTEQFLKGLIKKYGKHSISTDDGGPWYPPPQACKFLNIKHHHIHSYYYEKEALLKGLSNI